MFFRELTLVGAMALALAGCGGGDNPPNNGGGGNGGNNGGGLPPVGTFSGSTSDAVLTPENVGYYLAFLFDGPATLASDDGVLAAPQERSLLPAPKSLLGLAGFGDNPGPQSRATVSETMTCQRGSVAVSGTLNDNDGTGTLTLQLNKCFDGAVEMTGRAVVVINEYDVFQQKPTEYSIGYDGVNVRDSANVVTRLQGFVDVVVAGSCSESIISNIVGQSDVRTGNFYARQLREQTVNVRDDRGYSTCAQSFSGELFVGDFGRVILSTPQPLIWEIFPLFGKSDFAEQLYSGVFSLESSQSLFKINVAGTRTPDYGVFGALAAVELDQDKDGALELDESIASLFLSFPGVIDFGDDDADGMLDGWEKYHGLVVGQDDSLEDNDGDGFNNLAEFRGNHDPNDLYDEPYIYLAAKLACVAAMAPEFVNDSSQSLARALVPKFAGTTGPECWGVVVEVGESAELSLEVTGQVSEPAAESLEHYRVEAELSALGSWSIIEGDGCVIQETLGAAPRLLCDALPLSAFVDGAGMYEHTISAAKLRFRAQESGSDLVEILAKWATAEQNSTEFLTIHSASTAATLVASERLHVFKVGSDNPVYAIFDHRIQGEGQPVGYSFEAHLENPTPGLKFLDPSAVDVNSYDDCVIADFELSCRYDGHGMDGGISLPLTPATAAGVSTLELEVTTHYRSGASNVHRVQSEVVFGHATEELQGLVSGAKRDGEVVEVDAPDGIYVGPLDVENVIVNASQNFHLYLYEPSASGLSLDVGAATLMLGENSQLSGGNYYLHDRSLVVKNGTTVANATFNMRDARYGVATIEGQSSFVANKFFGTGQNESNTWGWYAAFKLVSGAYIFTLNNNLFKSESSYHYVISSDAEGVDVLLMNNTFAQNGLLIEHPPGSTVSYTLVNNVVQEQSSFDESNGLMYLGSILGRPVLNVNNNVLPVKWSGANDGYELGNNIYTDTPMLDPETLAPLPGSPAIDAGVDLSADFTTDLLGNPRPVGAGFDIGAIEVQAP